MGVDGSRAWSRRSPSASWKQRPAPGRADARLVVVGDPRHRGHRPVQEGPLHCRGRRHVLVSAQWGTGAGACATCRRSELAPLAAIWTRTSTKGSAASTALTDNVPHIRLCQNQSLYNQQVAVGCVPQQSEHMGLNLGHVLPIHLVRLNQLRGRDPRRRRQSCRPCRRRREGEPDNGTDPGPARRRSARLGPIAHWRRGRGYDGRRGAPAGAVGLIVSRNLGGAEIAANGDVVRLLDQTPASSIPPGRHRPAGQPVHRPSGQASGSTPGGKCARCSPRSPPRRQVAIPTVTRRRPLP